MFPTLIFRSLEFEQWQNQKRKKNLVCAVLQVVKGKRDVLCFLEAEPSLRDALLCVCSATHLLHCRDASICHLHVTSAPNNLLLSGFCGNCVFFRKVIYAFSQVGSFAQSYKSNFIFLATNVDGLNS